MAKVKRNWLSRLTFGTAALVISALLVLSYVSAFVNPARLWMFSLAGLLYMPLALTTLVFFIWALRRRARIGWLLLLMLVPSLFLAGRYVQLRKMPEAKDGVRIVSYNVGLFAHGPARMDRMVLADSLCAYLRRLDADILCLQEFRLPENQNMQAYLRRQFPGYRADFYTLTWSSGPVGNVTLSRLPVTGKGKISFERSTNMALYTDVRLDSATVRVYNCHFESYNISLSGLVKNLTDEEKVEQTGRKMRRSIRERPKQVAEVMKDVDSAPVRSVVAGDFNDTPLSYTCFRLLRGRHDSFVRAGKGFGATYSSLWPLLRIDYILYPKDLEAVSYRVDRVRYSDHYPVIASYYETGRNPR